MISFLKKIFRNDEELEELLKVIVLGVCGTTHSRFLHFIVGGGKTKDHPLLYLLRKTFGDYCSTLNADEFLKGNCVKEAALARFVIAEQMSKDTTIMWPSVLFPIDHPQGSCTCFVLCDSPPIMDETFKNRAKIHYFSQLEEVPNLDELKIPFMSYLISQYGRYLKEEKKF